MILFDLFSFSLEIVYDNFPKAVCSNVFPVSGLIWFAANPVLSINLNALRSSYDSIASKISPPKMVLPIDFTNPASFYIQYYNIIL